MLKKWDNLPQYIRTDAVRPYYDGLKKKRFSLVLKRGEAVAMLPGAEYTIYASGPCTIFKAFVPGGSSDVE